MSERTNACLNRKSVLRFLDPQPLAFRTCWHRRKHSYQPARDQGHRPPHDPRLVGQQLDSKLPKTSIPNHKQQSTYSILPMTFVILKATLKHDILVGQRSSRGRLLSLCCRTERFRRSFFPIAMSQSLYLSIYLDSPIDLKQLNKTISLATAATHLMDPIPTKLLNKLLSLDLQHAPYIYSFLWQYYF